MFKRLMRFLADPEGTQGNGSLEGHDSAQCMPVGNPAGGSTNPGPERQTEREENLRASARVEIGKFESFEEIYRNAPLQGPRMAYNILKVAEMVNSPYLAGMSQESKRSSLLMALEAASVKVDDLLQDAMVRQRALNEYEAAQHKKLKDFENAKVKENSLIQTALDRASAEHLGRIQANLDEVSHQQDNLRLWSKRKQQDSEQIVEAAAFCATQGGAGAGSLTATPGRFGTEAVASKR